ncbi:hypothetical protein [Papillibacter cinnamivorans]|uniref:hypothetical protein n=1 Tax=Papillibacter cinnamivorans TaxID=100176 RepID=UPI000A03B851|nr:hypothetical protein [Papillibacter cinnamivorans]
MTEPTQDRAEQKKGPTRQEPTGNNGLNQQKPKNIDPAKNRQAETTQKRQKSREGSNRPPIPSGHKKTSRITTTHTTRGTLQKQYATPHQRDAPTAGTAAQTAPTLTEIQKPQNKKQKEEPKKEKKATNRNQPIGEHPPAKNAKTTQGRINIPKHHKGKTPNPIPQTAHETQV